MPVPVSPSKKPPVLLMVIAIILLAVIGFGAYRMQGTDTDTTPPAEGISPSVAVPSQEPTIDVTELAKAPLMIIPEDWKTYTDDTAGFSFQYPSEKTEVSSSTPGEKVSISNCLTACLPYFDVSVNKDYSGTTDEWLKKKVQLASLDEYQLERMTVDGMDSLVALGTNTSGSVQSFVVIPKGSTAYLFTFPQIGNGIEESSAIKQIVSSFKLK
jgi:hypothetical protein